MTEVLEGASGGSKPRSERRQRTEIISVRVTPCERRRIEAAARQACCSGAADFLRERALADVLMPRDRALIIGRLAVIGDCLARAAAALKRADLLDAAERCGAHSTLLVSLQQMFAERNDDAG
jgi:hypothetical protein